MIQIVQQNHSVYGIYKYICDLKSEIEYLPTKTPLEGSETFVIETGDTYILNGENKWVLKLSNNSSDIQQLEKEKSQLEEQVLNLEIKIEELEKENASLKGSSA